MQSENAGKNYATFLEQEQLTRTSSEMQVDVAWIKKKNCLGFIIPRYLFIRNNRRFMARMENTVPRKFVSTAQIKQLRMK
jgi:hypothetical protein